MNNLSSDDGARARSVYNFLLIGVITLRRGWRVFGAIDLVLPDYRRNIDAVWSEFIDGISDVNGHCNPTWPITWLGQNMKQS